MLFAVGIALIGLTVAMVLLARPADGICAPFLRIWFVGQAYVLGALASAISGVTVMINNWPF
jgi:hypothetical protein